MKRNIFLMFFLALVLLQDWLLTARLVSIFRSLAELSGSLSSSYLFYLVGTVVFSTVVGIVLLLVFRGNTLLPKKLTNWIFYTLFGYQIAIVVTLVVAILMLL